MNKLKLVITAVCLSTLALFLLGAECGVPVDSLPPYYIMFKLDGESKIFDKGYTDIESNAFANKVGGNSTLFCATSDVLSSSDTKTNFIEISLNGFFEGEYSNENIYYFDNEGNVSLIFTNSIKITKYEDVSGVIEATFSGTGDGKVITEGVFKVKRIPNDTWD